jgi:hypothetical protein
MQDLLTVAFEAIALSFLVIMSIDFVRNFPFHPRLEHSPEPQRTFPTVTDPWDGEIETPMIKGEQDPEPKVQLLLLPAVFPREMKGWQRADELMKESIRSLKKHASQTGIKRYSNMTKNELIEALLMV